MSGAGSMGTAPRRDAMDLLWEGIHLKDEAVASGEPETMREAVSALEAVQMAFPEERSVVAKSLLQLSDCLQLTGDSEAAREVLLRVAHEFPHDDREAAGLALLGLSRIAAHEGRPLADIDTLWAQSFDTLADSLQREHAWIWHAQVHLQHGDTAGCRAHLAQIVDQLSLERVPHLFLWAQDLLGVSYIADGDRRQAQRIVEGLKHALSGLLPEQTLDSSMSETLLRSSQEARSSDTGRESLS